MFRTLFKSVHVSIDLEADSKAVPKKMQYQQYKLLHVIRFSYLRSKYGMNNAGNFSLTLSWPLQRVLIPLPPGNILNRFLLSL